MIRLHHTSLLAILLLAACDKRQDAGVTDESAEGTKPKFTRSSRPPREGAAGETDEPRVALKTALEIAESAPRDKALAEIAWNTLELDPELARKAFGALSADSTEKTRLIQHFALRMAELNPDDALEWAASLGSEKEIAAAKGQIALVLAETDPVRAADILSESGIAGRDFDVVTVQVLQRWAVKSPSGAAAWAVMFPAGQAREAGVKTVVSEWVKSDTPAAFAWMASLQDDAIRNEASLAMAEVLLQQPDDVRKSWLRHADAKTRSEIELQWENAIKEVGDNVPPSSK